MTAPTLGNPSAGLIRDLFARVQQFPWAWTIFVVFLFSNVLLGPIRWLFAISGLTFLIYLPIVAIGLAWMIGVARDMYFNRLTHAYFALLLVAAFGIVNGLLNIGSVIQVGFGFYVLWPMMFGLVYGREMVARLQNAYGLTVGLWLIASIGVIANSLTTYPWEGFEYSVGGVDVETSREWYAGGGVKRLAGLSRASFDAAIQVTLLSCLAFAVTRSLLIRIVMAGITIAAIYFTNAKGMFLSFMAMFALSMLNDAWLAKLKVFVFGALMMFGMGLPIGAWIAQYSFDITGVAANPLIYSFTDRIENMWPEALELMHEHGTVWLGRGFGGIGVSQTYFEPFLFNAADNVYVYVAAILGLGAFPVAMVVMIRFMTRRLKNPTGERFTYLLMTATLVYGLTANVFENAMMAMVAGILIRIACSKEQTP